MGADLGSDAILQRRDDLAARGVVLRVGREDEHHVELQPDGVTLDLDVALLKDVEEAHLDLSGEIRQFVDREDTPVGARQQAVVHRELVGEIEPRLRGLDRVDVPHHVRDRHIRGRELLDEAVLPEQPGDRQAIPFLHDARAAGAADGRQRIVVDFAPRDDGNPLVEQIHQGAEDPALRLAAQAEQDEIVARENRVDELRDDRVVVPDDAGEQPFSRLELPDEIVPDFLLDRPRQGTAALPQVAERLNGVRHESILSG